MTRFFKSLTLVCSLALSAVLPVQGATLKQLSLKATGGVELSPQFAPGTRQYQVSVQSDISAVLIDAQSAQEPNTVSVTVNGQPTDPKQPMLAPLKTGVNKVGIRASGSASDDYELTITRQDLSAVEASFLKLEFTDPATQAVMPYRLYLPRNMSAGTKYPLVVFLHGGGERGNDNEKTLTANQGATVWATPEAQSRPHWFELSPSEQQALEPLKTQWPSISAAQKRKWQAMAKNFASLPADEKNKLHARVQEWAQLSPQQRAVARLNFGDTAQHSVDHKRAKWEAYQSLSAEEKTKLAATSPTPPSGAATAIKKVASHKLAASPALKAPNLTGPKIDIDMLDPATLLPQAAQTAAAPSAPIQSE